MRTFRPWWSRLIAAAAVALLAGLVVPAQTTSASPVSRTAATAPADLFPLRVTPTAFDFGDVPVGTSSPSHMVSVTNLTDASVSFGLGSVEADGFIAASGCDGAPEVLAPGASCDITYAFAPEALGAVATTADLAFDLSASTITVPVHLRGNATFPITVSPTTLDFGAVETGQVSDPQVVTVTNTSRSPATFTAVAGASGDDLDPSAFPFTSTCDGPAQVLAPGAACTITYRFAPTVPTAAYRHITDGIPRIDLAIAGTTASQSTTLELQGHSASPIVASPTRFDFGDVVVGQSATRSTILTNTSDSAATFTLGGSGALQPFHGGTDCARPSATLLPGASCAVTYRFSPTAIGGVSRPGFLTMSGATTPSTFIELAGAGVAADPFPLAVSGTHLDFGTGVMLDDSAPDQTLTVTNTAATDMTFTATAAALTGPFVLASGCGGGLRTLSPGASCTLTVSFQPYRFGGERATTDLSLAISGGPARTFGLEVTGEASDPVRFTPSGVDFGPVPLGTSTPPQVVALTNVTAHSTEVGVTDLIRGAYSSSCYGVQTIAPGHHCDVNLGWVPTELGPSGGRGLGPVELTYGTGETRSAWLGAQATGVESIHVSTTGLDFGPVPVGETSSPQRIDVVNTAAVPVTFITTDLTPTGPFTGTSTCGNGVSVTLPAGAACHLDVRFAPMAAGPASGASPFGVKYTADQLPVVVTEAISFHGVGFHSSPVSPNWSFIQAGSADFLHRPPTTAEVSAIVSKLDAHQVTRRAVAVDLATSDESVGVIVDDLYQAILQRAADPRGRAHWIQQLASGKRSVAAASAEFYASSEYYRRFGFTDDNWITLLYRQILQREPDVGGLDYWSIQAIVHGRANVALRFFQSAESRRTRVRTLYLRLLGRTADPAGLDHWAARVLTLGDIALAVELAGSNEYLTKASARFP